MYNSNNYAIVFEARNAQVTFLGEKTNEVNQFLLSSNISLYLIRQSCQGYCPESDMPL